MKARTIRPDDRPCSSLEEQRYRDWASDFACEVEAEARHDGYAIEWDAFHRKVLADCVEFGLIPDPGGPPDPAPWVAAAFALNPGYVMTCAVLCVADMEPKDDDIPDDDD